MNSTDSLTGLNEFSVYSRAVASAPVGNEIILFDIDHLGRFMHTHGIEAADGLVQSIARAIDATAKGYEGTAYRTGGDEFVILVAAGRGIRCAVEAQARVAQLVPEVEAVDITPEQRVSVSAVACRLMSSAPEVRAVLLSHLISTLEHHKVAAGRGAPPAWCEAAQHDA
jgi:GGDEF domain-containing protein